MNRLICCLVRNPLCFETELFEQKTAPPVVLDAYRPTAESFLLQYFYTTTDLEPFIWVRCGAEALDRRRRCANEGSTWSPRRGASGSIHRATGKAADRRH
ncbi:hypothetical protein EVAR_7449_1 [Eumeta japonica]|uniref:Uncharacterized protein n=1 Tax=Eumeta variegata TaxID=151549 RepID=A0A4C1V7F4_EUMVA|nr:hypothetical protein EVAR_7449_1 [Eumeta japonica]